MKNVYVIFPTTSNVSLTNRYAYLSDEDGERRVYDYDTIDVFDGAPKKLIKKYTR